MAVPGQKDAAPAASHRWLVAALLPFLAYFLVLLVCDLRRPQDWGAALTVTPGGLLVSAVEPGSIAERAGLRAGDRLATVDGQTVSSRLDWIAFELTLPLDRAIDIDVVRDGDGPLDSARAPARRWSVLDDQGRHRARRLAAGPSGHADRCVSRLVVSPGYGGWPPGGVAARGGRGLHGGAAVSSCRGLEQPAIAGRVAAVDPVSQRGRRERDSLLVLRRLPRASTARPAGVGRRCGRRWASLFWHTKFVAALVASPGASHIRRPKGLEAILPLTALYVIASLALLVRGYRQLGLAARSPAHAGRRARHAVRVHARPAGRHRRTGAMRACSSRRRCSRRRS